MNTTINELPIPAGAEKVWDWYDVGTDTEGRSVNGRRWTIEGAHRRR